MRRIIGLLVAGTFAAATISAATAATTAASTAAPSSHATTSAASTHHRAALSRKRVAAIQTALNGMGEQLTVDGIWGRKTESALKDFQGKHGLKATGRADAATLRQLKVM